MKAVIFDLNGTLLDVRDAMYWQYQELTRQYDGAPVSRARIDAAIHGPTDQVVRELVRNTTVSFDEVRKRHHDLHTASYQHFLKLHPGVDELLPILRNMGVKVAVVSSDNHVAMSCLEKAGIHTYVDVVIDSTQITNPQPHPEIIDLAVEKLGVQHHEAVIVGDTVVDVLVGKNAGAHKTIVVSHGMASLRALHAAGPDHIVHDIPSILDVLE